MDLDIENEMAKMTKVNPLTNEIDKDYAWNLFSMTGNIDAYLLYAEQTEREIQGLH